jgi:hypothetical protein
MHGLSESKKQYMGVVQRIFLSFCRTRGFHGNPSNQERLLLYLEFAIGIGELSHQSRTPEGNRMESAITVQFDPLHLLLTTLQCSVGSRLKAPSVGGVALPCGTVLARHASNRELYALNMHTR